jgi:hypothetical protein
VFKVFQHQHRRALAHHEPIPLPIEGATRGLGVIIAGREHPDQGEGTEGERRQRSFRTPGQHDIDATIGDQPRSLANRQCSRRARVAVGQSRTGQAEVHRHVR